jgi:probable HAF family extracellular repeat protein
VPYFEAHANAINNRGQVVGEAQFPGSIYRKPCLWENGTVIDLTPGFFGAGAAVGINDSGQVITMNGYLWEDGKVTYLGRFFPAGYTRPYAINDVGQVVGEANIFGGSVRSFLWEDGILKDLSKIVGSTFWVYDINNLGMMAGSMPTPAGSRAATWSNGQLRELETLGGSRSSACCVNERNQVLGTSLLADETQNVHFLWDGKRMINLLAATEHRVVDIGVPDRSLNNCGDVLLFGDPPSRGTDYFLYSVQRGLRPIRGVTRPSSPWWQLYPTGMNDRGQIVGFGAVYGDGRAKGFVISPIPGDADTDEDVDLRDFAESQNAYTGPKEPSIPGCERNDLDADADVDAADFTLFAQTFYGPGVAPR